MELRLGDPTDVCVISLLEHHAATARQQTAAGSAHATISTRPLYPHLPAADN